MRRYRFSEKLLVLVVGLCLTAEFGDAFAKSAAEGGRQHGRRKPTYKKYTQRSMNIGKESSAYLEELESLLGNGYTLQEAVESLEDTKSGFCVDPSVPIRCNETTMYREIDGSCNNLVNPYWGVPYTPLRRLLPSVYDDGFNSPRGGIPDRLPNPRLISTKVHPDNIIFDALLTNLLAQFGQFVDHDITLAPEMDYRCCADESNERDCLPISVASFDRFYGDFNVTCLDFTRSTAYCFQDTNGTREQMNALTAFLDASNVYGSDKTLARHLREGKGGRLLRNGDNPMFLPTVEEVEEMYLGDLSDYEGTFAAGDTRVNEMPGLTVMHTLLFREHNRLAAEIQEAVPDMDDEDIYQAARRILIAEWQNVIYGEYLPIILGPSTMERYELGVKPPRPTQHDPTVDPNIIQAFSTAAYRFGHTLINGVIRMYKDINEVMRYRIRDGFFNDSIILFNNGEGYDLILNGLMQQSVQTYDRFVTQDLTNFLLRKSHENFGSDLVARNIQRARDHGVPPYGQYRELCGLAPLSSDWAIRPKEFSQDSWNQLESVYESPEDIDLFPGGLSEIPVADGLTGPVFNCIKAMQFYGMKYGDRFFFTHANEAGSFSQEQVSSIGKITLGDIICRNSDLPRTARNVFRSFNANSNPWINCTSTADRHQFHAADLL